MTLVLTAGGREILVSRPAGSAGPTDRQAFIAIDTQAAMLFDRATGNRIAPADAPARRRHSHDRARPAFPKAVDKFYGAIDHGVHAVRSINMDVMKGDIIALLGSSGCGKTSTLRMIAGFEEVSRGTIELAGRQAQMLPPVRRNVAMAFEGYSLYPTVTVRDNITFALKARRLPEAEGHGPRQRSREDAGNQRYPDRYPTSISGGQQQRASLARALVRDADLHFWTNPWASRAAASHPAARPDQAFHQERGLTAIPVTHDQTEANALADRIAVMEGGVLQQYGSPAEIKEQPANLFTGTFVGEPPMNVFNARASASRAGG